MILFNGSRELQGHGPGTYDTNFSYKRILNSSFSPFCLTRHYYMGDYCMVRSVCEELIILKFSMTEEAIIVTCERLQIQVYNSH